MVSAARRSRFAARLMHLDGAIALNLRIKASAFPQKLLAQRFHIDSIFATTGGEFVTDYSLSNSIGD
jgi:hypothetical protein